MLQFQLVTKRAGVFGLPRERLRNFYDQISIFKNSYSAVIIETADTLSDAKYLQRDINTNSFSIRRFNTDITNGLLQNPLLYKFSGNEYVFALSAYLQKAREANQLLEYLNYDFQADGLIHQQNVQRIKSKLDQLIYFTHLLQRQSQLYVYTYGSPEVLVPPNQGQVIDFILNYEKHTIDEIINYGNDIDKQKDRLHQGIWDVWLKMRDK